VNATLHCLGQCLTKIPWWAWLVLLLAGIVIIVWASGGSAVGIIAAVLGAIAGTFVNCVRECVSADASHA
jgi:drug/metabolite transporter (DMT)-like permease